MKFLCLQKNYFWFTSLNLFNPKNKEWKLEIQDSGLDTTFVVIIKIGFRSFSTLTGTLKKLTKCLPRYLFLVYIFCDLIFGKIF